MQPTDRANLPKRFYKDVTVEPGDAGFAVRLDGRGLKTPGRKEFAVPRREAAEAAAAEWRAQGERIDPGAMPVTRLCNTIIDAIAPDPDAVRQDLKRYAETDLLYYRADGPDRLVERQEREWGPALRWAEGRIGALFAVGSGVMHIAQPSETLDAFAALLDSESDPFALAALHQMTTLTGSLILALAVLDGHRDAQGAWGLAHLDEDWNIEQWGEDEEAASRRAARFADMRAAALVVGR